MRISGVAIALGVLGACKPPPSPAPTPPPPASPPMFGIGAGESDARTHVWFDAPAALTTARVEVVVDQVAPTGLNFFALQVDFDNHTWAHGGLQDVDGADGARTHQVNWGGLVDRGGGTDDYDEEQDLADLESIQNPPAGQHVGPYAWKPGVTYELRIERGEQVTLPPGDYQLIEDRPVVHVDHARTMWAWRFTARPISEDGAPFVAVLYDTADGFDAFTVWNESGYGSSSDQQHTRWWSAQYGTGGALTDATTWTRD